MLFSDSSLLAVTLRFLYLTSIVIRIGFRYLIVVSKIVRVPSLVPKITWLIGSFVMLVRG